MLWIVSFIITAIVAAEYKEVFFDDFDGTALDSSIWATWHNISHCSPCELQLYMSENVVVENGYLTINTVKASNIGSNGQLYNYTSGWVTSKDKMSFQYGKFEVRAKLPSNLATGAWPAHWLMPQSSQCWPTGGEIDIMEATASPAPGDYHIVGTYRWGTECTENRQILPGASYPRVKDPTIDYSADFHIFGVEWTENEIKFMVDDDVYSVVSADEVVFPEYPMYMILNTAVAFYMPPGPNAVYPATHVIDYVRISQLV